MRRRLYLSALLILQLALIVKLTPTLAHALRVDAAPGMAPAGWPAMLQLVATAAAVAGASLALVFPGVALSRHRRGGVLRFLGMPRWAVTLALGGTGILGAGTAALAFAPLLPDDAHTTAVFTAPSVIAGGLALATAGVLCAELLRRGGGVPRGAVPNVQARAGRIEVTHPPELRTRGA